ncbi:hypothetical protein Snoj_28180 [Streptomyces nojiriensis]|uniref:Secreted protein n=1 Tax=Streptomyces nojiriensis TaxID=66374 RepID=A0ABQ3SL92_9ACTN|nr:hypothetical protein [Streptomyces nojiriensis]QTI42499.1 hypothetical protein JYK04_00257 [Streptomyces nojiriensis]GGS39620.1 hypothetical protein GCM10010205_81650 [Streptomyces nojiriensis]GHI68900.1 hypothetical protein Snoj_28180 [Streptomyces nojiriensis]
MNRKALRMGGATVLAALAFGLGGGVAHAHTTTPAPAAAVAAPAVQEQQVRNVARALLNSPIELNATERTELQAVANGEAATAGRWDAIKKIASKIPGLAKAAKGNYDDFLKWYKALDWKWRAPLAAAGLGMDIYTLWQMFH